MLVMLQGFAPYTGADVHQHWSREPNLDEWRSHIQNQILKRYGLQFKILSHYEALFKEQANGTMGS